jgi:Fic family protein
LTDLRDKFHRALEPAGPRSHPIVEGLFTTPVLTIPDVAKQFEISYPTAKSDVDGLVNLGILTEIANTYPKLYYSEPIFNIAYDEEEK